MIKSFFRNFFESELKINILLLLISIFAYWEISILQYSVQYDMLDVILPWRFHVGECLRHFYFPYWNPYQSAGYPIHADLQCPTWYPETILIGSTVGYSNITLHILFILYIFISGSGMYRLTRHFGADNLPAFIAGAATMLSGVFVSNAQHLFLIVSMAWMPWVILYYLRLSEKPGGIKNILFLSLFTFLLISGGYQAISIVMGYLLFILFFYYCIRALVKRNYHDFLRIIKVNLAWLLTTGILCLVIIVSLRDVFHYVDRLSGLTLGQVMENPFTPRSLISLFLPYGVAKGPAFFGTDISMANLYMGIFMLGFFIAGLFIRIKAGLKILLIFGFIFLLASFGPYLPVREVLYKYFPLMDLFRIPGFLRVVIIIPAIITGGLAIHAFLKDPGKIWRRFAPPLVIMGIILMFLLGWSFLKISDHGLTFNDHDISLQDKIKALSIYEHILIHSIIQIFLLVSFYFLVRRKKKLKLIIPAFIIIEMFISVQMNIMYTGCSKDFYPLAIRAELKERPRGFPVTPPSEILSNTDGAAAFEPLWRNVNIFNKSVSFDAFTSFKLKGYKYLEDQVPSLKNAILRNRLVYLSDRIYNENDHPPDSIRSFHALDLFISEKDYFKVSKENLHSNPGDTVYLTEFSPHEIRTITRTAQPQILTLLQSNYKGWEVLVDGKTVPHFTSNQLFISFLLPVGHHEVKFIYKDNIVKAAFIISYLALLVVILLLVMDYLKEYFSSPFKILLPGVLIFLILFATVLLLNNMRQKQSDRIYHKYVTSVNEIAEKNPSSTGLIFMVDNQAELEKISEKQDIKIDYKVYTQCLPAMITRLGHDLSSNQKDKLLFAHINIRLWPEIPYLLNELYPGTEIIDRTRISSFIHYTSEATGKEKSLFLTYHDFESGAEGWSGDNNFLDTAQFYSGRYSNRLDSVNSFSYTFRLPRSEITGRKKFIINTSAKVMLTENVNTFLVIQIIRNDKTIGYYTRNIGETASERNVWNKVYFSKPIRYKLKPEDQLVVYVWNNSKGIMWVDDFLVEITLPDY
ncbi:MAG: hypothetical protein AMS27_01775 [Bacteroides sp. SM23_62_1]|nr:MAG: hypothetical protein AMS27_01775 [Bacteroides sp. SM23_62_1]